MSFSFLMWGTVIATSSQGRSLLGCHLTSRRTEGPSSFLWLMLPLASPTPPHLVLVFHLLTLIFVRLFSACFLNMEVLPIYGPGLLPLTPYFPRRGLLAYPIDSVSPLSTRKAQFLSLAPAFPWASGHPPVLSHPLAPTLAAVSSQTFPSFLSPSQRQHYHLCLRFEPPPIFDLHSTIHKCSVHCHIASP